MSVYEDRSLHEPTIKERGSCHCGERSTNVFAANPASTQKFIHVIRKTQNLRLNAQHAQTSGIPAKSRQRRQVQRRQLPQRCRHHQNLRLRDLISILSASHFLRVCSQKNFAPGMDSNFAEDIFPLFRIGKHCRWRHRSFVLALFFHGNVQTRDQRRARWMTYTLGVSFRHRTAARIVDPRFGCVAISSPRECRGGATFSQRTREPNWITSRMSRHTTEFLDFFDPLTLPGGGQAAIEISSQR